MDRPAYLLEFEKPLRELEKQLEALHQQSLENNIDMSSELATIEALITESFHPVRPQPRLRHDWLLPIVTPLSTGLQCCHVTTCWHHTMLHGYDA